MHAICMYLLCLFIKFKLQTPTKLNLDVTDFLDSPRKSELEVLLYADCISYCHDVSMNK